MNMYLYNEIKFSYTPSSFENIKKILHKKVNENEMYTLLSDNRGFEAIIDTNNKSTPQVYNGDLKAIFFPCTTTSGTIMLSNIKDGWETLCFQLSNKSEYGFYIIRLDESNLNDSMNSLCYINNGDVIRIVYSMKDPRWKFYQKGDALWFENKDYYNNRIISKRLNKKILTEYCNKLGLDIENELFWSIDESIIFQRNWK